MLFWVSNRIGGPLCVSYNLLVYGFAGVGVLRSVRCCASCFPIPVCGVRFRMLMCFLFWLQFPRALCVLVALAEFEFPLMWQWFNLNTVWRTCSLPPFVEVAFGGASLGSSESSGAVCSRCLCVVLVGFVFVIAIYISLHFRLG